MAEKHTPDFPWRPLMQELTEEANERMDDGFDGFDAYGWTYDQAKRRGLACDTYTPTAITSGGRA